MLLSGAVFRSTSFLRWVVRGNFLAGRSACISGHGGVHSSESAPGPRGQRAEALLRNATIPTTLSNCSHLSFRGISHVGGHHRRVGQPTAMARRQDHRIRTNHSCRCPLHSHQVQHAGSSHDGQWIWGCWIRHEQDVRDLPCGQD